MAGDRGLLPHRIARADSTPYVTQSFDPQPNPERQVQHVRDRKDRPSRPHSRLDRGLQSGLQSRQDQSVGRRVQGRKRQDARAGYGQGGGAPPPRERGDQVISADARRSDLRLPGPEADARRGPQHRGRGARRHGPLPRRDRCPAGCRRLHTQAASEICDLAQRPDLGKPPHHLRRRRPRGQNLRLPRSGHQWARLRRHAQFVGAGSGGRRGAAARLLSQPNRHRSDPRAVAAGRRAAQPARRAAAG